MELSQRRERLLRRLHQRKTRAREGLVLVEGVRAVTEALDGGAKPVFAVTGPEADRTEEGAALASRLSALERVEASSAQLRDAAATERPQGVLLVCEEPRTGLTDLGAGDLLVLDAVQDPGNVGTLIRSAAAFGFAGAVCLDGTADPWGPKAVRSSAGTVFRMPVSGCELSVAVRYFQERGTRLVVGAADGRPLADFMATEQVERGSIGVVVGNEGAGVRPELRKTSAATVAIEMKGQVESLNAAIAGSILMYRISEGRA